MNRYITLASHIALVHVAAGCAREPICCDDGYEYQHAGRTVEPPKPDERDAKIAMLEQERQSQTESLAALRSQVEDFERQLAAQEATRVTPVASVARCQEFGWPDPQKVELRQLSPRVVGTLCEICYP